MELYVVRHGETQLNRQKVLQGTTDSPLTEKGISQAQRTTQALSHIKFDQVILSNLGRAIHTAKILSEGRGKEIIIDENAAEMNFGVWQGRTKEEICVDEESTQNYFAYFQSPEKYKPCEGAESFEEVIERAKSIFDRMKKLAKENPDTKVLLVSHGAFIKAMLLYAKGNEIKDYWNEPLITNLSVTLFEIDEENIRLIKDADQSHLDEQLVYVQESGYLR